LVDQNDHLTVLRVRLVSGHPQGFDNPARGPAVDSQNMTKPPPLPPALDDRGSEQRPFRRSRSQRAGTELRLFQNEPGRRTAAKLLTRDEARHIAAAIAHCPNCWALSVLTPMRWSKGDKARLLKIVIRCRLASAAIRDEKHEEFHSCVHVHGSNGAERFRRNHVQAVSALSGRVGDRENL
jgi:hypothetical protein